MHKLYENNEIAVFWDSDRCIHAGECFRGCPLTFSPSKKPWIQLGNADNHKVWQTIEKCPSKALSVTSRLGVDVVMEPDKCRSAAYIGDELVGECEYSESGTGICIYHTGVRREHEGKGIAKRLIYTVLEYAEKNSINVSATCSYACKMLQ